MIDHLMCFPTEGAAIAALPGLRVGNDWDDARCIPGVTVTLRPAVLDTVTNPENPAVVAPAALAPGFWLLYAGPVLLTALTALPGTPRPCRFATDREASHGSPSVVYVAPDLDVALLATATVSPVFAGSGYYG